MTVAELIEKLREMNEDYEVFFEPDSSEDRRLPIRSVYVSAIWPNPPRMFEGDNGPEESKDPDRYIIAISNDP